MKNTILSLLALCAIASSLYSCQNKDGKIDSRQKINEIYAETSVSTGGVPSYSLDRHLVQRWMWDGDELYCIEYHENFSTYTENMFYDRRHRICRTTVPAHGLRSEFVYHKRQLESIEVYTHDVLTYTLRFTHNDGHITSIAQEFASTNISEKALQLNPLHLLAATEVCEVIQADNRQKIEAMRKSTYKGGRNVTYSLEWDDDNLASVTTDSPDGQSTMSFTYDNMRNPIKECYTMYEMLDDEPGAASLQDGQTNLLMLSENNILTLTRPFDNNDKFTFNYTYTYEGKYPATRKLEYEYHSMDNETYEETVIGVKETREFIYAE